ncbi:hypothetical protein LCGC14_0475340 [marine sediment metagenome]|uniref:Uncharacterized protein n=1 Tax=marine sediment metagenome TaxID=412755 RepID=A0A0F9UXU1_9ZZZZ
MYNYVEQRPKILTDEGQRLFLKIRDTAFEHLKRSGAFQMSAILGTDGDAWEILACVDRMMELVEIKELLQVGCAAQHRVFIKA